MYYKNNKKIICNKVSISTCFLRGYNLIIVNEIYSAQMNKH